MCVGIFLAYIRRRPSSRLRFHVFWEAGCDMIFLISEPGLLKEDLVLTGNLKQVIKSTMIYQYHYNMIYKYKHNDSR